MFIEYNHIKDTFISHDNWNEYSSTLASVIEPTHSSYKYNIKVGVGLFDTISQEMPLTGSFVIEALQKFFRHSNVVNCSASASRESNIELLVDKGLLRYTKNQLKKFEKEYLYECHPILFRRITIRKTSDVAYKILIYYISNHYIRDEISYISKKINRIKTINTFLAEN